MRWGLAKAKATIIESEDQVPAPVVPIVQYGTPNEQNAAWAIVKEALEGGWRSVGPYGPRADLYEMHRVRTTS